MIKRFNSTINNWLAQKFGHRDFVKFIVLTRSRSGSSLLMSLLSSHPNVETHGEYFRRLNGRSYHKMINNIFSSKPQKIKAVGFKMFYDHPYDEPNSDLWNYLANLTDIRILHLKRRNFLKTFVSRKIAGITNEWFAKQNKSIKGNIALTIDPEELYNSYNKYRNLERQRIILFENHKIMEIVYEEMTMDINDHFCKITKFLEIPFIQPKTDLVKQNTKKLREIIQNYNELRHYFANTELAIFFDD
jgi:LPS sulfotransferase NodH